MESRNFCKIADGPPLFPLLGAGFKPRTKWSSASSEYRDAALSGLRDNICRSKEALDCIVRAPIKTKQTRQFLIFTRTNCELVVRMVTKDTGVTFNRGGR